MDGGRKPFLDTHWRWPAKGSFIFAIRFEYQLHRVRVVCVCVCIHVQAYRTINTFVSMFLPILHCMAHNNLHECVIYLTVTNYLVVFVFVSIRSH